jgi:hypothetical protein
MNSQQGSRPSLPRLSRPGRVAAGVAAIVTALSVGATVHANAQAPRPQVTGGATSMVRCVYDDPTVAVTPLCAQLKLQALSSAHSYAPANSNNCTNSGLRLKYLSYNEDTYFKSFLETFQATGYFCYAFVGEDSGVNHFDGGDSWYANIRVWVCGGPRFHSGNYGTGPPATDDTPVYWYGSCGPQADDSGDFAKVDGAFHYFPYVSI